MPRCAPVGVWLLVLLAAYTHVATAAETHAGFGVSVTIANTCAVSTPSRAAALSGVSRCVYPQPAMIRAVPPTAGFARLGTGQAQGVTFVAIDY